MNFFIKKTIFLAVAFCFMPLCAMQSGGADYSHEDDTLVKSVTQALEKKEYQTVLSLIDEHDIDIQSLFDLGRTFLHKACQDDTQSGIDFSAALLKRGALINAVDEYGQTALHHSLNFTKINHVKFLLSQGADHTIFDEAGLRPIGIVLRNYDQYYPTIRATDREALKVLLSYGIGSEGAFNSSCSQNNKILITRVLANKQIFSTLNEEIDTENMKQLLKRQSTSRLYTALSRREIGFRKK